MAIPERAPSNVNSWREVRNAIDVLNQILKGIGATSGGLSQSFATAVAEASLPNHRRINGGFGINVVDRLPTSGLNRIDIIWQAGLADLSDVSIAIAVDPNANDFLKYDGTTSTWKNYDLLDENNDWSERNDFDQTPVGIFTKGIDVNRQTSVADPASNTRRIFTDGSNNSQLSVQTESGDTISLEEKKETHITLIALADARAF